MVSAPVPVPGAAVPLSRLGPVGAARPCAGSECALRGEEVWGRAGAVPLPPFALCRSLVVQAVPTRHAPPPRLSAALGRGALGVGGVTYRP